MNYFNHLDEELTQEDYLKVRDEFIEELQKVVNESMRNYPFERNLIVHRGRRYDKIVIEEVGSATEPFHLSVWGFIDKTNGNILKAESWKKPSTKNTRGNIYEDERMLFCGPYGPAYMDTIKDYYGT